MTGRGAESADRCRSRATSRLVSGRVWSPSPGRAVAKPRKLADRLAGRHATASLWPAPGGPTAPITGGKLPVWASLAWLASLRRAQAALAAPSATKGRFALALPLPAASSRCSITNLPPRLLSHGEARSGHDRPSNKQRSISLVPLHSTALKVGKNLQVVCVFAKLEDFYHLRSILHIMRSSAEL